LLKAFAGRSLNAMTGTIQKYNAAEKLKDAGQLDEAVALLNEILAETPDHILSHLTLGRIYTLQGKFEQAVAHGQQACQLEPKDPFNFTALSVTYQRVFAGTQDHKYIQMAEDAMAESRRLESMR
jgi:tetratricopeptide (TPR) repeat protein